MEWFRDHSTIGRPLVIGVHHGHNHEIQFTGSNSAKGIWQLFQYTIYANTNRGRRHAGSYVDEYIKESDGWKLKFTSTINTFREEFDREQQGLESIH